MKLEDIKETPSLLFVDDEKNVLRSLNRLFFEENYDIKLADSGAEGLDFLRAKTVQVIVSDQRMPGMNGVEFLIESQKIQPQAVKILLTGYTDLPAAQAAINEGKIYKFFTKPWQDIEIKLAMKRAIEHFFLQKHNLELLELTRKQNAELTQLNSELNDKVKQRTQKISEQNQTLNELNQQLAGSFGKMIRVMLNFIELKSPDLSSHSKRVAAASRYIAAALGLREEEIRTIEVAALLHDIGKIGLPGKVLTQLETRMNPEEYALYQRHPLMGQNAIMRIETLHQEGMIIRHHHENYNGTGFPDKLRGEEIPLGARIIAAADTYDKMINQIFPKAVNPRQRIKQALEETRGVELDRKIVDGLLKIVEIRTKNKSTRSEDEEKFKEISLKPFELKEGMILSRDLFTSRGTKILSKNRRLDMADIKAVLDADRLEKLFTEVFVYA